MRRGKEPTFAGSERTFPLGMLPVRNVPQEVHRESLDGQRSSEKR